MTEGRTRRDSSGKQMLSLLLTIAAIALLTGMGGGSIEVFGTSVPIWLPAIALYVLGVLSGWLLGDQPISSLLLRRRRQ